MTKLPKDTRARLIDVTARLLMASPAGEVSTREICEAAGVKPPTIYHHFGDKEGLLHAVVADGLRCYLSRAEALGPGDDVIEVLRRSWNTHVEFGLTYPGLYTIMYGGLGDNRGGASEAAAMARAELITAIRTVEDTGRLRLPVEVAADTVEAAAVGTALWLIRTGGAVDDPAAVVIRDAVTASVVGPARVYTGTSASPEIRGIAAQLRDVLPGGPIATLRASETALLRDWLGDLADTPPE